jgi:hypothetical protein
VWCPGNRGRWIWDATLHKLDKKKKRSEGVGKDQQGQGQELRWSEFAERMIFIPLMMGLSGFAHNTFPVSCFSNSLPARNYDNYITVASESNDPIR